MKTKIILTAIFILFVAVTNAQLLINVKEYRIGFGGKFLSYETPSENIVPIATAATETITTRNPVTGQTTTINRPVATTVAKTTEISKGSKNTGMVLNNAVKKGVNYVSKEPDLLVMELNNYASNSQFEKDKQIWIIEYVWSGTFNAYYTIKNKASGKYLTHIEDIPNPTLDLRPYISSSSKYQRWTLKNLEELTNNSLPFYGKTREVLFVGEDKPQPTGSLSIKPAMLRLDNVSGKVGLDAYGSGQASLDPATGARRIDNRYNFFITPAVSATKIELTNIETPICPTAVLKGDRDFNSQTVGEAVVEVFGDGSLKRPPMTTFEINLVISDDKKEIWADIKLNVKEEKSDFTETEGKWRRKVYTAPAGRLLNEIISDKNYRRQLAGHFQKNTARNNTNFNCEFMEYFIVIGDTMGNDISDDDNCHDDTRIEKIVFRPLFVTFQ